MSRRFDVAIIGSGPAGLLSATYIAENTDFNFALIAPCLDVNAWHCTYCSWKDAIDKTWLSSVSQEIFQYLWDAKTELTCGFKDLEKYCQLDNKKIVEACFAILKKSKQATLIEGRADCVQPRSVDVTSNGEKQHIEARYVVDCTGPYSTAQAPIQNGIFPTRYQIFYGEVLNWPNHGLEFNLMDYGIHFDDDIVDSFAYVLPISKDKIFIEETILVHDEKLSTDITKNRFPERLKALGMKDVDARDCEFAESYAIPMGGALPPKSGAIRFGACGRMVHPSTGFCFSYTVSKVPVLVQALQENKCNEEIWDLLHADWATYYWHCFGQEMLNQFTTNTTYRGFFTAVFTNKDWFKFMTRRLSFSETLVNAASTALYFDKATLLAFLRALFVVISTLIWRSISRFPSLLKISVGLVVAVFFTIGI